MHHRLLLLAPITLLCISCGGDNDSDTTSGNLASNCPDGETCYQVTFSPQWTRANFPVRYPSGAHFSPIIGATHGPGVHFFQLNQSASAGIEQMAETGATGLLTNEISSAIAAGTAEAVIQGSGINSGSGSTTVEFSVNPTYPVVTLTSMIAPSPDWFVGVNSLSLQDSQGEFYDELTVNLVVYDAGTDSGVTFTSGNDDENSVITRLTCEDLEQHCGFVDGEGTQGVVYIGTFEFMKL